VFNFSDISDNYFWEPNVIAEAWVIVTAAGRLKKANNECRGVINVHYPFSLSVKGLPRPKGSSFCATAAQNLPKLVTQALEVACLPVRVLWPFLSAPRRRFIAASVARGRSPGL
jgi:hypothetical protein